MGKWMWVCLLPVVLAGCGISAGGNYNSDVTTNISKDTGTSHSFTATTKTDFGGMTSQSIPFTKNPGGAFVSFQIPSGWTKRKVSQGADSAGYVWLDPYNNNQQIQLILSKNTSSIKDLTTGQWDVTDVFGHGTQGITWTNVSTNKLTGEFTDTRDTTNNGISQYTGYGKAFIVTNPNPFSVYIEIWGKRKLSSKVLLSVQLHQSSDEPLGSPPPNDVGSGNS